MRADELRPHARKNPPPVVGGDTPNWRGAANTSCGTFVPQEICRKFRHRIRHIQPRKNCDNGLVRRRDDTPPSEGEAGFPRRHAGGVHRHEPIVSVGSQQMSRGSSSQADRPRVAGSGRGRSCLQPRRVRELQVIAQPCRGRTRNFCRNDSRIDVRKVESRQPPARRVPFVHSRHTDSAEGRSWYQVSVCRRSVMAALEVQARRHDAAGRPDRIQAT